MSGYNLYAFLDAKGLLEIVLMISSYWKLSPVNFDFYQGLNMPTNRIHWFILGGEDRKRDLQALSILHVKHAAGLISIVLAKSKFYLRRVDGDGCIGLSGCSS
jgi:hypothetical protein